MDYERSRPPGSHMHPEGHQDTPRQVPGAEPPASETPAAEPAEPAGAAGPAAPASRNGISTGAKLLIGCFGLSMFLFVGAGIALFFGGGYLMERTRALVAGLERQAEATERLDRLRAEHPFTVPVGGELSEAHAGAFFAVTDDAWIEVQGWADELRDLMIGIEGTNASLSDIGAGVRTLAQLGEARVAFAEVLERHEISPDEYLWTGMSLLRAHAELDAPPDGRSSPAANLSLAGRHRADLDALFARPEDGGLARGMPLYLALAFGQLDGSSWTALGLDTLGLDLLALDTLGVDLRR